MTHGTDAQLKRAQALESEGRVAEAAEILRRAASSGDIAAVAALGKHLLIHRPDLAREAMQAVLAAAGGGHGESNHIVAVFVAEGVGFQQNWQSALGLLQRSAEQGWLPAQRELVLLAGSSPPEAAACGDWKALRERVDVAALLAPPRPRAIPAGPRIFAAEAFARPAMCDWLIELARPWLKSATTYDPATGIQRHESGRTNSDCHLVLPRSDLVLAFLRARIANLVGLPVKFFEVPTMLHYLPSQEFAVHHDFLDDTQPGYAKEVAEGGQRVLTFLLYLNDGFEGGETDFPIAGVRYKGGKGDALFFWNVLPDSTLDRRTLHAGLPPKTGEKWLLSQWIRNRAM